MQNILTLSKLLITLSVITFNLNAYADDDNEGIFKRWLDTRNAGVSSVKFQQYNYLCGSCHFSYQPGLLPGISWEKIMNNLEDHFGQKVKMSAVDRRTMRRYLLDNSAGHVNDKISEQILQSLNYNPVPIRITKTSFFISKHNPHYEDKYSHNISQCDSCHHDAQQGQYSKHKIHLPAQ